MYKNNQALSAIFHEMAGIYQYKGTDRFRALAYDKASRVISSLPEDIAEYVEKDTLKEIPGIGAHTADKIKEFIKTGRILKYESLKKTVPQEILNMLDIPGFGPQSLKEIHNRLKINTRDELVTALKSGRITKLKGFGQKKVDNMLSGLQLHKTVESRMLLWDALDAGEQVLEKLRQLPEVIQADLAGSLRRKKETIGDIDILVSCKEDDRKKIVSYFTSSNMASRILAKGDTKASIIHKNSSKEIDIRLITPKEWGSALQYFTGSKEHNVHLRTIARNKGYKISEYGLFTIKGNKWIAGRTEEDIYRTLGFKIMPPEMREDRGEIELAQKGNIPELVSLHDICGDLHVHSTWSDGSRTIEELVDFVIKRYSYKFIVITDHSKSVRVAGGMDEKQILKQWKEIDKLNKKLGRDFIKKGIEVDILPDSSLDMSSEILSQLDWVIASVHSNFKSDNTQKIIEACNNPYVTCIGHPTGRLIGSREPYKVDMGEIIRAAKRTGTVLEINAQPWRMDLNDEMVRQARENGVKFAITTDTHDLAQFNFMKLGIYIARRAWCTADDIVNTMSWDKLKRLTEKKRLGKEATLV